jgi:uncharacterized protein
MSDTPVSRLPSLDIVRGVAVMGILLLNIVNFGMPTAAYFNPRGYGGSGGADLAVYLVNFILFDGRMRGLFSFLFGASLLLVTGRAETKGESPASVHYRRMLWLLAFGLAHLWLVWDGDILAHYAIVGMAAYLFRNLAPHRMIGMGVVLILVQIVIVGGLPFGVYMMEHVPAHSAGAADAARQLAGFNHDFGIPPPSEIAHDLAFHRGAYGPLLAERLHENPLFLLMVYGCETLAYMLFGMAAFRTGLLSGQWTRAQYRKGLLIGFGIGIPVYTALEIFMINSDFSLFSVLLAVMALATPVRPFMILGWACLILLLATPGGALTTRIAAAGRMAFTNYLATSLICTTLFYGYGLGWYGLLSRAQLYLVVLAIWALMLLWSKPWLARFRYGPFEWFWRSLARWRFQPMRGPAAID